MRKRQRSKGFRLYPILLVLLVLVLTLLAYRNIRIAPTEVVEGTLAPPPYMTPTSIININDGGGGNTAPANAAEVSGNVISGNPKLHPPDIMALKQLMFDLINADRAEAGLAPVVWDDTAALAGQQHAEDMAEHGFFSHWNQAGYGPDYRYSALGGLNMVSENIHTTWNRYSDGSPAPIEDWEGLITKGQANLMSSPGHKENILDPVHTHVGIGLAYNPELGQFWLSQEFVNHYVDIQPIPHSLPLGSTHPLQGHLLRGASEPLINIAYAPFPQPRTLADLENTSTYMPPGESFHAINPTLNGEDFTADLGFDNAGQAGLYQVRIWVTLAGYNEKVLVVQKSVEVR